MRKIIIIIAVILAIAVSAILLINRGKKVSVEKNGSTSTPSPTISTNTQIVKVGTVGIALPFSFVAAQEKGFFEKNNLTIKNTEVLGVAAQSLASGQIQFLLTRPATPILATAEGADIKWVATLERTYSYSFFSDKPKNLIKKVGSNNAGTNDYYATIIALSALGIDPKKVEFVFAKDTNSKVLLFKNNAVDAGGLGISSTIRLQKDIPENYKELINLSDAPKAIVPDGVLTTGKFLSESPLVVKSFIKALIEASNWAKNNPKESVMIIEKKYSLKEDLAKKIYDDFLKTTKDNDFTSDPSLFKASFDAAVYGNPKVATFDINTFFTNDAVSDARKDIK